MNVGDIVDRHRVVVCVGTGGVGKTTLAAAIGLGAALRGRRVMVLTIDPARQLARSLGLDSLKPGGEPVPADALAAAGLQPSGSLEAGMLDQKRAWDRFITRHAPPDLLERILSNPFYQQLSTSFSGLTEYMAIEELCHLAESDHRDLLVLDTPPATHALDFLTAPERIDRLLDRDLSGWLTRPYQRVGRGAWRAAGATVRFLLRRLEHAAGRGTLRDISAFFIAVDAFAADLTRRTAQARALLYGPDAAFVLVAGPEQLVVAETEALAERLRSHRARLQAIVLNRTHPRAALPTTADAFLAAVTDAGADPAAVAWMRDIWTHARDRADAETTDRARLDAALPAGIARADIPESDHDTHSLADLAAIARDLWA